MWIPDDAGHVVVTFHKIVHSNQWVIRQVNMLRTCTRQVQFINFESNQTMKHQPVEYCIRTRVTLQNQRRHGHFRLKIQNFHLSFVHSEHCSLGVGRDLTQFQNVLKKFPISAKLRKEAE